MNNFCLAMCHEIEARREEILLARANTLYIGGGTPSQLPIIFLRKITNCVLDIVPLEKDAEVTMEVNPDDVNKEFVEALRDLPVNRISMGVQTFDDGLLRFLHRRHTSRQVYHAVELLRENGYDNLSLDLIYGLPGQSMDMWKKDVQEVLALGVPHLSAYSLQYEQGTPLWRMRESGEVQEADEELSLAMYEFLMDETERVGMEHYEISNFAMPGMRSRHNSGYWRDDAYVGLGPGAHSYDGKRRRSWNAPDLDDYCMRWGGRDGDSNLVASSCSSASDYEILTDEELYDEKIMKGLRTREGIDMNSLSPERRKYLQKASSEHIKRGLLTQKNAHLRLTKRGIFISNDIMSDLML